MILDGQPIKYAKDVQCLSQFDAKLFPSLGLGRPLFRNSTTSVLVTRDTPLDIPVTTLDCLAPVSYSPVQRCWWALCSRCGSALAVAVCRRVYFSQIEPFGSALPLKDLVRATLGLTACERTRSSS